MVPYPGFFHAHLVRDFERVEAVTEKRVSLGPLPAG
jgi:hypothetical protein